MSALSSGARRSRFPTQRQGQEEEEAQSFIWRTLLGQATLQVAFYAKSFGLIQTLIFSEVNEINRLRTVAG